MRLPNDRVGIACACPSGQRAAHYHRPEVSEKKSYLKCLTHSNYRE